ncbi:ABC transporter permease [Aedoeadaptatus pacaensis]|uniref:ABC transporter permease n=1 Tax=Aedoeadaptatus pacaensis TaxID=1776390 RepID=UPI0008391B50|nr:ABC transporter permease [Peptoniphilus pacaensis]
MFSVFSIEVKKIKWLPLLLAILVVPLLATSFGTFNYMGNRAALTHEWESLFTQISLFYFSFFYVPLIAIIVALLWQVEHKAGLNFIRLSTAKYSRFIFAKSLLACFLIVIAQIFFFSCFYLAGRFVCGFGNLDFSLYFYYFFASILLAIPAVFVFSALSIRMKSLGGVTLLSVALSMFGFLACAQQFIPMIENAFALNTLAYEMNHFARFTIRDSLIVLGFALAESLIAYVFARRSLKYE